MDELAPSLNEPLDIFGQNPRLSRLYTQLCFCFPLLDRPRRIENTVSHLQRGLDIFTTRFPWVAGQVIQTDDGTFTIVPLEDSPQLLVQDKSHQLPAFEEYRSGKFPFKWLNEKNIASHSTLPTHGEELAPVLALQATFISGGVFLTFSAQHNCMDMTGQSQVIRLFSEACHEAASSIGEKSAKGNLPYEHVASSFKDTSETPEADILTTLKRSGVLDKELFVDSKAAWSYFLFPSIALSTLKSLAQKDMHTAFISTDDTICAFIWKMITKVRLSRLTDVAAAMPSTFERQVDVRKFLSLPATHIGNAVYKTSTTQSIGDVVSKPLGYLASELRASLSSTPDLGYRAQQDATELHQKLKTGRLGIDYVKRGRISAMDIKMSSWAKEDCYNFDFGGSLGRPEAVRRPDFKGGEGLAYLMPKSRTGEVVAAVCLREDDLIALQEDEEFGRFAQYVG